MSTEILFEEIQGSNKIKNRNLYWILSAIFAAALLINTVLQKNSESNFTTVLWCGLVLFAIPGLIALINFKLVTQIRSDGIYIRWFPFEFSFRRYSWDIIEEIYIRKYNAMTEYFGLGLRFGPMGRGYIVPGNMGLQIVFKDKSKLLITTQKPDEIADILNRLNKMH